MLDQLKDKVLAINFSEFNGILEKEALQQMENVLMSGINSVLKENDHGNLRVKVTVIDAQTDFNDKMNKWLGGENG